MAACNSCRKNGIYQLKMTFYQDKGTPRFGVTFEAEGVYCLACKERIERLAKRGEYLEISSAQLRAEVQTCFELRGWGKVRWGETGVSFEELKAEDKNLKLPLDLVRN